jgi:hypothetical protein
LVFGETIKFRPLTLLERDLIRRASSGGFMNACSISARKQILPTVASSAIGARWS